MNAPRHGHTDSGSGGGVLIGCVAFAVLAFSVSLGGVVYFLTARPVAPPFVPTPMPPPSAVMPVSAAEPSPPLPEPLPAEPAAEVGGEGTVISAIDPSREVGAPADGPVVGTGAAEVRGSLDRDVIRRVVRRHINEVRFCYEQGLVRQPDLSGRVTVSLVISATGAVSAAQLGDSTFVDTNTSGQVVECILAAVRRWQFPAPEGGGIVAVTYPFVLTSD